MWHGQWKGESGGINNSNTTPLLNPVNPSPCPQAWLTTTMGSSILPLRVTFRCPSHSVTYYFHLPARRLQPGTEARDDEARDGLATTRQDPREIPATGRISLGARRRFPAVGWRSLASRCSRIRSQFRLGGTYCTKVVRAARAVPLRVQVRHEPLYILMQGPGEDPE